MFDRATLKERGKVAYKKNYWMAVLVALILTWAAGSGSVNTSSFRNIGNSSSSSSYNSYSYDDDDDDYDLDDFDFDDHGDNGSDAVLFGMLGALTGVIIVVALFIWALALAFSIFIKNPLKVGAKRWFTLNSFDNPKINEVGFAFKKGQYMSVVKVEFMKDLFIFLWSLLFIIPGIIKSYEYYMVDYILTEDPTIDYKDALEMSKRMMDGNKWATFVLELSFIGWILLSVLTCGILSIFMVNPYMYATESELFLELRNRYFGPDKPYFTPNFAGGYGNAGYNAGGYNQAQSYGDPYTQASYAPQQPYNPNNQDPYAQPQAPADPYAQPQTPADPYAQPQEPNPYYGQEPADPYGQQPNDDNNTPYGI